MISKLKILDDITNLEDLLESKYKDIIKEQVIKSITEKYGNDGVVVVNKYYSDSDDIEEDDCPECAEKAKRLIQSINMASKISESLVQNDVINLYNRINDNFKLNSEIDRIIDTLKTTFITNNELVTKVLIKTLTERLQNGSEG